MSGAFHADAAVVFPSIATASQWPLLAWAALGVVLLLAAVSSYGWWRATRPVERPLTRLRVDLGPDAVRAPRDSVALSPDGTRIVFVGRASESGTRQLFTRRLDEQTAQPLPGTTFGASLSMPFFSPAGDWIAFLAGNSLRKVSVQGGSIVEVAGHLVFVRQGTLFAVPFDPTRLETRGTPTPLLNEVGDTGLLEGRGTVHVFDERNIRVLRAPDWYHQLASDLLAECVRSADAAPRSARRVYDAAAIA